MYHGQGELVYKNYMKFKGEFENGVRTDNGKFYYGNGAPIKNWRPKKELKDKEYKNQSYLSQLFNYYVRYDFKGDCDFDFKKTGDKGADFLF